MDILVASQGEYSLMPELAGGLHLDFADAANAIERIAVAHRTAPLSALVPTDDLTVELASLAGAVLGLPHNPPQAARAARRKDLGRAALAAAGLPVPAFRRVDLFAALDLQLQDLSYPCVIKPLTLSGSRGVIRANDRQQLHDAWQRVQKILADQPIPEERQFALVEDYLPGAEVAVEGLISNGEVQVLAIFDKPDPLQGPFFEETYYVTPSRLPEASIMRVVQRMQEACRAYGLREGPVHAEFRVHDGEAWMLEMAARTIGGDCARVLERVIGRPLEELVLECAMGGQPALSPPQLAAGVLMIPIPGAGLLRRVEGVAEARRVPLVEDVVIAIGEGYAMQPLPEGSSYLGFIFAAGPSAEDVEAALRQAHACLKVVRVPAWQVEVG